MKHRFCIMVMYMSSVSLAAQETIPTDSIMHRLLTQSSLLPQENLYVHTDKSDYVAGDTLWFRAYTVNAVSRRPDNLSRYVYAELIDAQTDTVMCRVRARTDTLGQVYGHVPLPLTLPKGTHQLRAYTRYACNWEDADGFFRKPIRIYSANEPKKQKKSVRANNYQVDFFPEGGQAISEQPCRIAFKAQNNLGIGESIHGLVIDEKGDTLTQFRTLHKGMGEFTITRSANKQYTVWCVNNEGDKKHFELPAPVTHHAALKITTSAQAYHVQVVYNSSAATDSLRVAVLQRGYPRFIGGWKEGTTSMVFPKKLFDAGVVHFLLLARDGKIISERLLFANPSSTPTLKLSSDRAKHVPRQQVNVSVEVSDGENNPLEGSCSVSVTDAADVPLNETVHILSRLLLTADIQGKVESPNWYFEKGDEKERMHALDLLMLTQGWRRYNLQAALYGEYTHPKLLPENSMKLSGKVETALGKPASNSSVQVYAQGEAMMTELKTDKEGRFEVDGFEFPDSVKYLVTALTRKGKESGVLKLNPEKHPIIAPLPPIHNREIRTSKAAEIIKEEEYIRKSMQNIGYSEGMRHYQLNEVKITAPVKKREYQTEFERDAQVTILEERIRETGINRLHTLLAAVGGFYVTEANMDKITFVLDDVKIDVTESEAKKWLLYDFNPEDIGQIDIIKGPLAAGYFEGKQFYIISVSTKRGGEQYNSKFVNKNMTIWTPLGYQKPIERYTPKYNSEKSYTDNPDMRTTIYWKPNLNICKGKVSFPFYTADTPSSYNVVIEGITTDGKVFRKVERLFKSDYSPN